MAIVMQPLALFNDEADHALMLTFSEGLSMLWCYISNHMVHPAGSKMGIFVVEDYADASNMLAWWGNKAGRQGLRIWVHSAMKASSGPDAQRLRQHFPPGYLPST